MMMQMEEQTRDERLLDKAWSIIRGAKVKLTVYERKAALLHLRTVVDRELAQVEREVGHLVIADKASLGAPAPSHTNSEGGAKSAAPETAIDGAPRPSLPNDDGEGQAVAADEASTSAPSPSSPIHSAAGQSLLAGKASHHAPARAVVPLAKPQTGSQIAGAARAMMKVAPKVVSMTILDTLKVRGGIAIGDVRYNALEQIQVSNEWEAAFIQELRKIGIPADRSLRVRDYLTPTQVQAAKKAVEVRFHNVA